MLKHTTYGPYEKYIKRPQDFLCALLAMIVLSPVMLVVAILVRIKLGSPVLFTQERPGKEGKIFKLYKFRTMLPPKDGVIDPKQDAIRLTTFGKKLRATSLDELPELFNMMKGDMAVVGSRPLLVQYLDRYDEHQARRHEVRPGFTGLAQVHGRNAISWEEKFDWDVKYVDHITFLEDWKIIFKTVATVWKREGISAAEDTTMPEFMGSDKNLVIIAAGGCGREVLQWAKDVNSAENRWRIKGFIDDNLNALDGLKCDTKVLSAIESYEIRPDDEFICCIGNSNVRKRVVERLKAKGAKFTTLIHPTAVIADSCTLGEGAIVYPFALISDNAVIGDQCIINMYSSVAHDSVLGEYCTISAHCDITGMCRVGDRVFMGTSSNMAPSSKIGDDVYICAGSTVMGRVRAGNKMLGNPAKIVKF